MNDWVSEKSERSSLMQGRKTQDIYNRRHLISNKEFPFSQEVSKLFQHILDFADVNWLPGLL